MVWEIDEEKMCAAEHHTNLVAGFKGLTVCSTGFTGDDLLHLTKVIPLMGR
jgi:hypothetical protein